MTGPASAARERGSNTLALRILCGAPDVLQIRRVGLIGWGRVQTTPGPIQMAALRTSDHSLCSALVFCDILRDQYIDGNPSYSKVIAELKEERKLGRRCRCRTCPYLNNNLEQDHRAIKRRVHASQGFRSFDGAWRTIQLRGAAYDSEGPSAVTERGCGWAVLFVNETFGLKAAKSPWE